SHGDSLQNRHAFSDFPFKYIFRLRSCKLMDAFIISPLPPSVAGRSLTAGPLCSPDITPVHRSYEPIRHPPTFDSLPSVHGYRIYLAPKISLWGE
ncbi:MAG TPA: hypothetical protein VEF33_04140, partial [Syntrophales bacterium]|nr:hypothetical protein [Syntrophales bacterium]